MTSMKKSSAGRSNEISVQNTTAWASDENILPAKDDRDSLGDKTPGEITIDQEISIRSEQATGLDAYNGGGAKAFGETKATITGG